MKPQDIVAILLTLGVLLMLLSGTYIRCFWLECPAEFSPEKTAFWKDVMNILLGGLIGYMAGKGTET